MKKPPFKFHLPVSDRSYFGTHSTRYARIRPYGNDDEQGMATWWAVYHTPRTAKELQKHGVVLQLPDDLGKDGFLRVALDQTPPTGLNLTQEQEFCLLELLIECKYTPSPLMLRYLERLLNTAPFTVTTKRAPH